MENRHGGARAGAGRKPKALKYAPIAEQVEQTIVDAIPDIITKLIAMAKAGDVAAARYAVDRILGRVAVLDAAPIQDTSLPYNENDFDRAVYRRVRDLSKSYREEAEWKKEVEARYQAWLTQPASTSGDTLDDLKRAVEEDDRRRRMGSPPDSSGDPN